MQLGEEVNRGLIAAFVLIPPAHLPASPRASELACRQADEGETTTVTCNGWDGLRCLLMCPVDVVTEKALRDRIRQRVLEEAVPL